MQDEQQQLEHHYDLEIFKGWTFNKIPLHLLEHDGVRFTNETVQLVFEAFLYGRSQQDTKVIGQQLYAGIRETSKYTSQADWQRSRGPYPFPVRFQAAKDCYVIRGGVGGQYRLEDVELYIKSGEELARVF